MEKGQLREIFLSACNEIAAPLAADGWRSSQKGQCWKKKHSDKDLTFEVYFQSSTKNDADYIILIPRLGIKSLKAKAYDIAQTGNQHCQGFVWSGNLGSISPRNNYGAWNVAGERWQSSIDEMSDYFVRYGLPIFELFEQPSKAVAVLRERGALFYEHMIKYDTLMPLTFMMLYGLKDDAEQFFNGHVRRNSAKAKMIELYKSLAEADNIDLCYHEFHQAGSVKQAYVEGLELWEEV